MKKSIPQFELSCARDVFNLAGGTGIDPFRAERERWEMERRREEREDYQKKMQRALEECPGFIGGDAPGSPAATGKVVVDPGVVGEAVVWLKRRFRVNENLSLSMDSALCLEIISRSAPRRIGGPSRLRATFDKPEQFELAL